jgi:hypothetical protein
MNSRINYKLPKSRDSSKDDIFIKYTYEKRIKVLSTNKDGSVDKYVEENFWKEESSSWSDYMKSFDLGTPHEQVMSHLQKGTPLVTAHVLPDADFTKLQKGAEIRKEMAEKGISLEMIISALQDAVVEKQVKEESKDSEGGKE